MNVDIAYELISRLHNISIEKLKILLNDNSSVICTNPHSPNQSVTVLPKPIILPFYGTIISTRCHAIVYNHGLYTQCTKEINNSLNDICRQCLPLKYGRIEDRLNFKEKQFITKNGKKEIPYEKFMAKMKYSLEDVNAELHKQGIVYEIIINKKTNSKQGRGRPRKIIENSESSDNKSDTDDNQPDNIDNNEKLTRNNYDTKSTEDHGEIEVESININGILYFKTSEDIILHSDKYEVLGIYKNGRIKKMKE